MLEAELCPQRSVVQEARELAAIERALLLEEHRSDIVAAALAAHRLPGGLSPRAGIGWSSQPRSWS